MNKNSKIYLAGHTGMVGSALLRRLRQKGYNNIVTRTHKELDLCRQSDVENFFSVERPEYVFLAAAKVGGIFANQEFKADFMYENLMIELNVTNAAWKMGCKKLMFLGSSCIYPKFAIQPIKETSLLKGELEKTNESFSLAKISGLKYCEALNSQYHTNFIAVMPTNLYGPNDNYHPLYSHLLAALIRKMHEAKEKNIKEVTCWGTGTPQRDYMFVDDLADACLFLMEKYEGIEPINIGTGKEISVKDMAELVAGIVGFKGKINWDNSKLDGMPRKMLDISKIKNMGWSSTVELKTGIQLTYKDFLDQKKCKKEMDI